MKRQPFQFIPHHSVYSVVERVEDIELLIGQMTGEPYIGGKFTRLPDRQNYKIVDVEVWPRHTVFVEKV